MKEARLASHAAYIRALPYYTYYEEYNGHPPLHPHVTATLNHQIAQADWDLQRNIDADWRSCVIRYPEVLAHYYTLVRITLPNEAIPPSAPSYIAPAGLLTPNSTSESQARFTVSKSGSTKKKERRNSLSLSGGGSKAAAGDKPLHKSIAQLFAERLAGSDGSVANGAETYPKKSSLAGRGTPVPEHQSGKMSASKGRMSREYILSGAPTRAPSPPNDWDDLSSRFL